MARLEILPQFFDMCDKIVFLKSSFSSNGGSSSSSTRDGNFIHPQWVPAKITHTGRLKTRKMGTGN